jgi:hypothetical protein
MYDHQLIDKRMRNLVETASGEIVEVIAGTLTCENAIRNWFTIVEWMKEQDEMTATVEIREGRIFVSNLNTGSMTTINSLLEHFEYQK